MSESEKPHYVEFPAKNIPATNDFFIDVFGWPFQDFGPDYSAFTGQGIHGGFYKSALRSSTANGGALIAIYSADLEAALGEVERADGTVVKAIFSFPGDQRFHYTEPGGHELAVWSNKGG